MFVVEEFSGIVSTKENPVLMYLVSKKVLVWMVGLDEEDFVLISVLFGVRDQKGVAVLGRC